MIHIKQPQDFMELKQYCFVNTAFLSFSEEKLHNWIKLTSDKNPIHDPNLHTNPVIPGNMLISYIPSILQEIFCLEPNIVGFNLGYKLIRFRKTIRLNDKISTYTMLNSIHIRRNIVYINWEMRFISHLIEQQTFCDFLIQDRYEF